MKVVYLRMRRETKCVSVNVQIVGKRRQALGEELKSKDAERKNESKALEELGSKFCLNVMQLHLKWLLAICMNYPTTLLEFHVPISVSDFMPIY